LADGHGKDWASENRPKKRAMCIDISTGVGKNICSWDYAKKAEKTTAHPADF